MTLRPVDLQIVVQKSAEVMKSRFEEDSRTRLQLQQQAQQLQQKERVESHQVRSLQKTDKKAINNKKEKDGGGQNPGRGKDKKRKQKDMGGERVSTIDIKI